MSREAYDAKGAAAQAGTYVGLYRGGHPSNGDVIHRTGCSYMPKRRLPWQWAEGRSWKEVEATSVYGLRFCKHCDPIAWLKGRLLSSHEVA